MKRTCWSGYKQVGMKLKMVNKYLMYGINVNRRPKLVDGMYWSLMNGATM